MAARLGTSTGVVLGRRRRREAREYNMMRAGARMGLLEEVGNKEVLRYPQTVAKSKTWNYVCQCSSREYYTVLIY